MFLRNVEFYLLGWGIVNFVFLLFVILGRFLFVKCKVIVRI